MIGRKPAAAEAFSSHKLQRPDFSANEEPIGPVSLLVVAGIPAYNEERTIAKVVVVSLRQVDKVVVCNDGSTDMTGIIASKLGAEVISHDRNLGKGEALRSLFKVARSIGADVLVTWDAAQESDVIVSMGCGDACPIFPGKRYEDWKLDDPAGRSVDAVRPIRDEIRARVERLLDELTAS